MYDKAYKKELAYERVEKVWEIIVNCIEEWQRVRMSSSQWEQLKEPFRAFFSCPYESLSYMEGNGDVYYLGQVKDGYPNGIGMNLTEMGDNHYCKMYIGRWIDGERDGGNGVFFNFYGDETKWFIQHQTHSNYGSKRVNFQIDWKGITR